MGNSCVCSERTREEEAGITRAEAMLKLHGVSAKKFDQEIRRVAVQHCLTM
jgi:hypothetical protein